MAWASGELSERRHPSQHLHHPTRRHGTDQHPLLLQRSTAALATARRNAEGRGHGDDVSAPAGLGALVLGLLVDIGSADPFFEKQLQPNDLKAESERCG